MASINKLSNSMTEELKNLILTIVSSVNSMESYVSKTKLLKLLYLFDVEYYRLHKKLYTGFDWIYFHLGPWTSIYDSVIDRLVSTDYLNVRRSSDPSFDTEFFRTPIYYDATSLFGSYKDELILKRLISIWGGKSTSEILDHVYFDTEPMVKGIRNEKLDFSTIADQVAKEYKRPSSGKSHEEIEAFKRKVKERLETKNTNDKSEFTFTPPNYDENFFKAMKILEESR